MSKSKICFFVSQFTHYLRKENNLNLSTKISLVGDVDLQNCAKSKHPLRFYSEKHIFFNFCLAFYYLLIAFDMFNLLGS